ncbi:MAG TPA: PAS domain S-box protein [Desulfatiglandales bacterium]|nr:PAS domain S-box protein [Desulfatiglandales bacterium]
MNDQTAFIEVSIDQFLRTEVSSRETQKAAQKLAKNYAPLLNHFNDAIFIIDQAGHFVFVNKEIEKRMGIPTKTFIGRHFLELIDPKYHEFAQSSFQEAMNGEKVPQVEMQRETADGEKITQEVNWITIYEDGIAVALLGVSRDVTDRKRAEEALKGAREELEMRVRERTAELLKANELLEKEVRERKVAERGLKKSDKALKMKAKNLGEANAALRVLLKSRQEDKTELEENVVFNVRELVEPYLKKIQRTRLTARQKAYLSILESNLKEVVLPFSQSLYAKFMNLTHSEIQIANLVKHGMTSKEINEMLHVSTKTVEFHRDNIRKKIGIKNTKTNLRSYLLSLK